MTDTHIKKRGMDKLKSIPIIREQDVSTLSKPAWLKVKLNHSPTVSALMRKLRDRNLSSVCEEASCPNLHECFSHGTASFMIMGDICTRRCRFCDVAHGKPKPLNPQEPLHLATTIAELNLSYVVITSVDRDDLPDGGARHFAQCIDQLRQTCPSLIIEVLTPDFRGRNKLEHAITIFSNTPPDVFNHNIETVPRLYKSARPGSNYQHSLKLLQLVKQNIPSIPTKSGLMLGLGETNQEVVETLKDLRAHEVDRVTLGQYLAPSKHHLPVDRYVEPQEFLAFKRIAETLGFSHVASGPLVRSSYHADKQARGEAVC